MNASIDFIKQEFENFVTNTFGHQIDLTCHPIDGYRDEIVNAVWIGFAAGCKLAP